MDEHAQSRPQPGPVLDRRRLIRDATVVTGGAAAVSVLAPNLVTAGTGKPVIWLNQAATPGATPVGTPTAPPVDLASYVPNHLTKAELATLKAALDRIIPSDELGPGANEAGAFVYIDRSLGGRYQDALSVYQAGLAALDSAAGADGFAAADADTQDAILTVAESGQLVGAPPGFFTLLLNHTREGTFCDPVHGGNANFVGWDLIGYPGIKLYWTPEDQAIDATPKPEHISVAKYQGGAS